MNCMLCLEAHSSTGRQADAWIVLYKWDVLHQGCDDGWGLLRGLRVGAGALSLLPAHGRLLLEEVQLCRMPVTLLRNHCRSFWQAVAVWLASGFILLMYRAGEVFFVSHFLPLNIRCTILGIRSWQWAAFDLFSTVHFFPMRWPWLALVCSGAPLPKETMSTQFSVTTATGLSDNGFFCRCFCSHKHLSPAVAALRGTAYVQCCERGSNPPAPGMGTGLTSGDWNSHPLPLAFAFFPSPP